MAVLSDHILAEIRELPGRFPEPRSAVMPALDLAQEELGHLTPDAMTEVAAALGVDPGYVEGVATFYTLFHTEPVGKHRMYICTNLACMLRGAEAVVERALERTGCERVERVSPDGLFSVEEVECLGACEYAPMMRLDHRYWYDLTPESVEGIVADFKSGKGANQNPDGPSGSSNGAAHRPPPGASRRPPPARGGRRPHA